ncbi:MAG: hypothetical protein DRR19_04915 [Candidatus Parabeggiatoa sp. nov. 1]|nr:MAG: hypothetical protein DRR19_04915 [Gammaproteobacteria bacterium]
MVFGGLIFSGFVSCGPKPNGTHDSSRGVVFGATPLVKEVPLAPSPPITLNEEYTLSTLEGCRKKGDCQDALK